MNNKRILTHVVPPKVETSDWVRVHFFTQKSHSSKDFYLEFIDGALYIAEQMQKMIENKRAIKLDPPVLIKKGQIVWRDPAGKYFFGESDFNKAKTEIVLPVQATVET